jgi:[acyl-carrier-protein] S-malonyltransferase
MRDQSVDVLVELGSGRVLSGLVKRIDRDMTATAVGTPDEIDALVAVQ